MDYGDLNIPHEIKSETYFGKGIFLLDLANHCSVDDLSKERKSLV